MNNMAKKRKKIKEYPTKPVQTKVVGLPNTVFFFTETKAGCKMFFTTLSNTPKKFMKISILNFGRDVWYHFKGDLKKLDQKRSLVYRDFR